MSNLSKTEAFVLLRVSGMSDQEAREASGLASPPGRAYELVRACERLKRAPQTEWLEEELEAARQKARDLEMLIRARDLLEHV